MSPDALSVGEVLRATEPWQLPTSWVWAPLGLLTSVISRGRAPSYVSSGGVVVLNQRCIRWNKIDFRYVKRTSDESFRKYPDHLIAQSGDILWNSTGSGTIGRAAIYRRQHSCGPVLVDTHLSIVRCAHCLPEYVSRFLSTLHVQKIISDLNVGSTNQLELPRSVIAELKIPLPPLAEQRRIVARIDELFAEITEGADALERARRGLGTWHRALLKAAVTGELTRDWREANRPAETGADLLARIRAELEAIVAPGRGKGLPSALNSDAVSLANLPDRWVHAPLGDFISRIEAGLNVKALGRPPGFNKIGIVKVSAVTWGEFDELASKTLPPEPAFDEADVIKPGDFLFSRANTLELVGAPVIVKQCTKKLILSDKVLRFRLVGGLDRWIEMFLKSIYGRIQIEAFSTGNQLSMRNISQENIKRIVVPVPPEKELRELLKGLRSHGRWWRRICSGHFQIGDRRERPSPIDP